MERDKKKKGKGRERLEDQLVKRNITGNKKKRKLLNKNNIIASNNMFDANVHHYDHDNVHHVNEYNDDNNDMMPKRGRGVFDFPWLHEEEHGNGSMFTDNGDYDYDYIDQYYHHSFFLGFEEYYYGGTVPSAQTVNVDACCSSSSSLLLDNRNDQKCVVSDNENKHELEKMEYYIWSSVLDQPLDIGLFNKYL